MTTTEVHYEICEEDGEGFDPIGFSYVTRDEAEAELRRILGQYPGAFVIRTTMTRVGPRQARRLRAV